MQADCAFIEFAGIDDAMNGIGRIDGARLRDVHLDRVGGFELGAPALQVLVNEMEIFHVQAADGDGHPAILVAMIMYGTSLPDFPANGHQFVQRRPVDEIARVVLAVPVQVGPERIGADGCVLKQAADWFGRAEGGFGELAETFDQGLNGDGLNYGGHGAFRR